MSKQALTPLLLPADPTSALEAATKQYVDTNVTGLQSALDAKMPKSGGTFTGAIDFNAGVTVSGNPIQYRAVGSDFNTAQGTFSTTLAINVASNRPEDWCALVNLPAVGGRDGQFAWYFGNAGLPGRLWFRGWGDIGAWQTWNRVTLGVGGAGRIFVQSTDPGSTADDGDLWVW